MEGFSSDEKQRSAPEEIWLLVDSTDIPCLYFLYRVTVHKVVYEKKVKQSERDLMIQKAKMLTSLY